MPALYSGSAPSPGPEHACIHDHPAEPFSSAGPGAIYGVGYRNWGQDPMNSEELSPTLGRSMAAMEDEEE